MNTIFDEEEKPTAVPDASEPSPGFRSWWQPHGYNPATGAGIGGHRDAFRKCVNTEIKQIGYYGVKVGIAWKTESYRAEYRQWLRDGMPGREIEDDTSAKLANIKECFGDLRQIMKPLFERAEYAKRGPASVERAVGEFCSGIQREPEDGSCKPKTSFQAAKQIMKA